MRRSLIKTLQNFYLSILALFLLYALLEFVIFPAVLPKLPLRYHGYLTHPIQVFAQSSKQGLIPKNYIAILGDSYAAGNGDWLLSSNEWKNPPFASQHVIHRKLKRDVVSLGKTAVGSIGSLIVRPLMWHRYLKSTRFYKVSGPETILVYFYEGNDLKDNLMELKNKFSISLEPDQSFNKNRFQKLFDEKFLKDNVMSFKWYHNLFFLRFIKNLLIAQKEGPRDFKENSYMAVLKNGNTTKVIVNNEIKPLPDGLQGPALELSDGEVNLSIAVFRESLHYLEGLFPKSKIIVVYIPSVLSSYKIVSEQVSVAYWLDFHLHPSRIVTQRSDFISGRIKEIAEDNGFVFIDTRPTLRKLAERQFIHGPVDWKHFNQDGYEAFAEAIIPFLSA